jgi:hypothetical protein
VENETFRVEVEVKYREGSLDGDKQPWKCAVVRYVRSGRVRLDTLQVRGCTRFSLVYEFRALTF